MSMLATGNLKGRFQNNLGNVLSEEYPNAVNTEAFEKGDILFVAKSGGDSGKMKRATSADNGPFYFCKEAKAMTDTKVYVLFQAGQRVSVVTDDTLTPLCRVKAGTTPGRVMKLVEGTDSTDKVVGTYQFISANIPQGGAGTALTNATAGTVIDIDLKGIF